MTDIENRENRPLDHTIQMVEALKAGQLPTNAQANQIMKTFDEEVIHQTAREAGISKSGKELLLKTEKAMDVTRRVLQEKNPDNQIQDLLYHTRIAAEKLHPVVMKVGRQVKQENDVQLSDDLSRIWDDLTRIAILFSRSYEFRRLLGQLNQTMFNFMNMFTKQLQNTAGNLTQTANETVRNVAQEVKKHTSADQNSQDLDLDGQQSESALDTQVKDGGIAELQGLDEDMSNVNISGNDEFGLNQNQYESGLGDATSGSSGADYGTTGLSSGNYGTTGLSSGNYGTTGLSSGNYGTTGLSSGLNSGQNYESGYDATQNYSSGLSGGQNYGTSVLTSDHYGTTGGLGSGQTYGSTDLGSAGLGSGQQLQFGSTGLTDEEHYETPGLTSGNYGSTGLTSGGHYGTIGLNTAGSYGTTGLNSGVGSGYNQTGLNTGYGNDSGFLSTDDVNQNEGFQKVNDKIDKEDIKQGIHEVKEKIEGNTEDAKNKANKVQKGVQKHVKQAGEKISGHAKELKQNVSHYIDEDKIAEFLTQLKDSFVRVCKSQEYKRTMTDLLAVLERLYQTFQQTASITTNTDAVHESLESEEQRQRRIGFEQLEKAKADLRSLLENLAGGYSLKSLINEWTDLNESLAEDQQATDYLQQWADFFRKILLNPEFLEHESYRREGAQLVRESGNYLMNGYQSNFSALSQEVTEFLASIANDKLLNQFASQWGEVFLSLFLNEYGVPTLKPELLFDTGKIFFYLIERVGIVPLPPMSNSDDEVAYEIDQCFLVTDKAVPNTLETLIRAQMSDSSPEKHDDPGHYVRVTLDKISIGAKDVKFWYEKKKTPKLRDSGILDLTMDDQGMQVVVELIPTPNDKLHLYRVQNVEAKIHGLNLKIHESHHQVLYTLFHPILKAKIKKSIENEVAEKLRKALEDLDQNLLSLTNMSRDLFIPANASTDPDRLPVWGSPVFNVNN